MKPKRSRLGPASSNQQPQQQPEHDSNRLSPPYQTQSSARSRAISKGSSKPSQTSTAATGHKSMAQVRSNNNGQRVAGFAHICSGCKKPIKKDKFLLKACDRYWHENCLKCDRCNGRLGELGSTLYCKSNMNLCRQDYLELFGQTGICSVCEKLISASEMVMRAKQNIYHLECFACQLCNQRFCVGDRFYLCENKVVCQYDYEEHILPIQQSLEHNSSALPNGYYGLNAIHEPTDSHLEPMEQSAEYSIARESEPGLAQIDLITPVHDSDQGLTLLEPSSAACLEADSLAQSMDSNASQMVAGSHESEI